MTGSRPPSPDRAGVLLDLDDTLVDTRYAFGQAISAIVATWLPHLDAEGEAAALQHWVRDAGGHFRAYTRGESSFAEQRHRRAVALHAAFDGPTLSVADQHRWSEAYDVAFREAWRLFPDAVPLLERLELLGLPYGLVTNAGAAYQRDKLQRVGLADRFEVMVAVDDLGVGKPDPRVFHLACERLGVSPGRSLYLGDEPDADARGARAAGLVGVWLDRSWGGRGDLDGQPTPDDVPVVGSLLELADLLDAGAFPTLVRI